MDSKKLNNDSPRSPLSRGRGDGGEGEKGRNMPKIPLHAGAEPHQFKHARELRREMTDAEKALWQHLRARQFLNLKFRRQHPILDFIADFYCHKLRLIVEADGGYHEESDVKYYDKERTKELKRYGMTVVRFSNEEIMNDMDGVLKRLKTFVVKLKSDPPLPRPLSSKERGYDEPEPDAESSNDNSLHTKASLLKEKDLGRGRKTEKSPKQYKPKTTPSPPRRGSGRGQIGEES